MVAERDTEASYRQFCRVGRPLRYLAICFVISVVVPRDVNKYGPLSSQIFGAIGSNFVGFDLPIYLAAYSGRKWFRQILLGRLTGVQMIVVALVAVALSHSVAWALGRLAGTNIASATWGDVFRPAEGIWATYFRGPFVEEMLVQVAIQSNLQRFGAAFAVIASTAAFTAFHLYGGYVQPKIVFVYIFPPLLSFAIIRQTTKSTGAAMLAHSLSNLLPSF